MHSSARVGPLASRQKERGVLLKENCLKLFLVHLGWHCCWPKTVSLGFKLEGGTSHEGVLFRKSMGDVCSKTHFQ